MSQDRLKAAARAISGLDPMVPYRYLYRAQVIAQSASNLDQVDVRPDDPSVPEMAGVPLRHGIPGVQVQVRAGCHVVVGWANGQPDAPFAALWEPGADVVRLILSGTSIEIGGTGEAAVNGTTQASELGKVITSIGSALLSLGQLDQAKDCASFVTAIPSTLSSKVKLG